MKKSTMKLSGVSTFCEYAKKLLVKSRSRSRSSLELRNFIFW